MARDDKYYAQFDGVDIDGKRYAHGDEIDTSDVHPAVIEVLAQNGQISSNNPSLSAVVITSETKPVDKMTRSELVASARAAVVASFDTGVAEADDDQLRQMIERHRDDVVNAALADDGGAGDGSVGGTPYAEIKDKPLNTLKTAELDTIAREEHVSFDGAKNNTDRVKAIEDARKAKG